MYTVSKYTSLCTQMVKPVSIGTVLQVFVAFVSRVSVKPTNQFKDLSFHRCFKWRELGANQLNSELTTPSKRFIAKITNT